MCTLLAPTTCVIACFNDRPTPPITHNLTSEGIRERRILTASFNYILDTKHDDLQSLSAYSQSPCLPHFSDSVNSPRSRAHAYMGRSGAYFPKSATCIAHAHVLCKCTQKWVQKKRIVSCQAPSNPDNCLSAGLFLCTTDRHVQCSTPKSKSWFPMQAALMFIMFKNRTCHAQHSSEGVGNSWTHGAGFFWCNTSSLTKLYNSLCVLKRAWNAIAASLRGTFHRPYLKRLCHE